MPANNQNAAGCTTGSCGTGVPWSSCAGGPAQVNYAKTDSFKVWDLVNKLCQTELKVWKWACNVSKFASLPYLFFDKSNYDMSAGGIAKILQFKNIPQFHTLSEDGESVKRWEMVEAFPEAFVDGAQSGTDIKVKTLESLRRFFAKDYVIIFACDPANPCCQLEIGANIISIDTSTLTIKFDRVVTVCDGDRILRQYNLIETCGEFHNGVALQPTDYFNSYYQYFGGELCFTQKELNVCYATERAAWDVVEAKFSAMYQDLFLQVGNAYWRGMNVQEIAGTQAAQTMGILPAIYRHYALGKNIIHDLSSKTVDQAKVRALLEIFEQAQQCQIEGIDNTLVVACNYKFYNALSKLNPAWQAFAACMPICDKSMEVNFEVKVINTIYGRVEFYADFFLQYYYPNKSFAVVLPKGMTAMYMPENRRVSIQNNNWTIEKIVPGFQVIDLDIKNIGKIGCGSCVEFYSQFAFIHAGVASGAYRIIEGLY